MLSRSDSQSPSNSFTSKSDLHSRATFDSTQHEAAFGGVEEDVSRQSAATGTAHIPTTVDISPIASAAIIPKAIGDTSDSRRLSEMFDNTSSLGSLQSQMLSLRKELEFVRDSSHARIVQLETRVLQLEAELRHMPSMLTAMLASTGPMPRRMQHTSHFSPSDELYAVRHTDTVGRGHSHGSTGRSHESGRSHVQSHGTSHYGHRHEHSHSRDRDRIRDRQRLSPTKHTTSGSTKRRTLRRDKQQRHRSGEKGRVGHRHRHTSSTRKRRHKRHSHSSDSDSSVLVTVSHTHSSDTTSTASQPSTAVPLSMRTKWRPRGHREIPLLSQTTGMTSPPPVADSLFDDMKRERERRRVVGVGKAEREEDDLRAAHQSFGELPVSDCSRFPEADRVVVRRSSDGRVLGLSVASGTHYLRIKHVDESGYAYKSGVRKGSKIVCIGRETRPGQMMQALKDCSQMEYVLYIQKSTKKAVVIPKSS